MNETCMGLILVNISVHRLCEEMAKRKDRVQGTNSNCRFCKPDRTQSPWLSQIETHLTIIE